MKILRKAGATSQILQVFIQDSSSTTGAGLAGLAFGTSGLTAYYHRDTDTSATAISLVTMTVGTFTSSGFKEIDSTNMPGWYQFCLPNVALASGAASVAIHLKGAANMAPLPIEIDLAATTDTVTTLTNLPSIPSNWLTATGIDSTADAEIAGAVWDLATSGHTTAGSFGAAATAGGSGPSAATIAAAVWDEVNTGATHNTTDSAGKQLRTLSGNTSTIYTGTCPSQAGMTSTQIKLDSGASSTNNVYRYDVISIISGTNAGDSRIITGYVGSTKVASVDDDWTTQPDGTSVFEVTPTARSQVVNYMTGQDPATLVWAAATRTLTAMPTIPTNWLTADGLASDAVAEIQSGLSTYAGGDTSGVTALLARLTTTRAGNLDKLDATISSRSTYAGEDTAGTSTLLTRLTSTRASHLDNLDEAISTLPSASANADAMLGRNIAGGADGGRTVAEAMAFLRNKWTIAAGTLTVYETNDSSVAWTATVSTSASNPITGVDPA